MRVATVQTFKPSGKFYTEESLVIPEEVPIFEIPEYVKKSFEGRFEDMHIYISGDFEGMYPMMIPADKRGV